MEHRHTNMETTISVMNKQNRLLKVLIVFLLIVILLLMIIVFLLNRQSDQLDQILYQLDGTGHDSLGWWIRRFIEDYGNYLGLG